MKQVLVVAHAYPPCTAVGAIRPSKFVHYLPEFGWKSIVLACRDGHQGIPVNSTAEIYQVREWPHPLKTYLRFMEGRAKKRGRSEEFADQMIASNVPISYPGIAGLKRGLLNLLNLPDQELGWLIPATLKAVWLIRQKKITHLITTAPPFTSHLIGLAVKRLTGVRWLADFRDPWSLHHKFPIHRRGMTDAVEARLIRWVMESADLVLSVTPGLTEEARKEHPTAKPEKFVTLTNGFDPADFAGLPMRRPSEGPTIFSYIGSFYRGHSPELFFRALRSLLDDGLISSEEVKVKFVGDIALTGGFITNMIEQLGLKAVVSVYLPVPFGKAMELNGEAHVCIVFTEPYPFSSKVYNALAAGATILNIGSCPEMAELLARTGRGVAVSSSSLREMRDGIIECIRRSRSKSKKTLEPWREPGIQCFNYEKLTCRLAELLEGLELTKTSGSHEHRIRQCSG